MNTNLPKQLVRLTTALLKHQAGAWLGEEALGVAGGTLTEIAGEDLQTRLDRWLKVVPPHPHRTKQPEIPRRRLTFDA